jgi:hypothetical protein
VNCVQYAHVWLQRIESRAMKNLTMKFIDAFRDLLLEEFEK